MNDLRAGIVFLVNALLISILVFAYSTEIKKTGLQLSAQLGVLQGIAYLIALSLALSSLYFFTRSKIKAKLSSLKKDLFELSNDEFKIYKLAKRKLSLQIISKKTRMPKEKIKRIIQRMSEKGILKTSKSGKIRVLI